MKSQTMTISEKMNLLDEALRNLSLTLSQKMELLTKAYETLAPMGVYVSADVFGTIICNESDGRLIGQDYVEMAKQMKTAVEDWLFAEWANSRDYHPIEELIRTLQSQDLS